MEVYELTGNTAYLKYSTDWAEYNHWKGAASDNKAEWRYGYGETPQYVLFGDWQCCFQTYADLYGIRGDDRRIAVPVKCWSIRWGLIKMTTGGGLTGFIW